MASHKRYLMKLGGSFYAGSKIKQRLINCLNVPNAIETQDDLIKAVTKVGGQLWIFREPRVVKRSRSRYQKICHYYGLGKDRNEEEAVLHLKQVLAQQGGLHGRANRNNGPPAQVERIIVGAPAQPGGLQVFEGQWGVAGNNVQFIPR